LYTETMPEENPTNPQQSTSKAINWKLIGIIAVIAAIVIGGLGYAAVVLDFFGTKVQETPQTTKQASPSAKAKQKEKAVKIFWTTDYEIWLKEENKNSRKVVTETKKILDWEVLQDGKIAYITAEKVEDENEYDDADEYYGTKIIIFDLSTNKKETLLSIPLKTILAGEKSNVACRTEDPDISTLAISPDNKILAYARSGLWLINLGSKNTKQVLKTAALQQPVSKNTELVAPCIVYQDLRWVEGNLIEIETGRWEWGEIALVNDKGKVFHKYNSSFGLTKQLTYSNQPLFLLVIDLPGEPQESDGSKIGVAEVDKEQGLNFKSVLYSTKDYIYDIEIIGNTIYFIEQKFRDLETNSYKLKTFNLTTKKTTTLQDLGTNNVRCFKLLGGNLYYEQSSKAKEMKIYKFDPKTSKQILIDTIQGNISGCVRFEKF